MENGITDVNCLNKDSKLWENPKLKDFLTFWFYEVEKNSVRPSTAGTFY